MASEATPRINAQYLDSFTNQTVRILGKVTSLRGETATLDANGSVNIHLNRVRLPFSACIQSRIMFYWLSRDYSRTPTLR